MFDMMKVAKKIKEARIARDMTQMKLAEEMDVSYQAVSSWERGNSMPDISKLEQLCGVLQISIDELLGAENYGQAVKKIMNIEKAGTSGSEENDLEGAGSKEIEKLTAEELQEVAPLLSPKEVQSYAEETVNGQEKKNLAAIVPLAPFLSEEALDELVQDISVEDIEEVVALAPFLSEETLDRLVMNARIKDLGKVVGLAPFLSEETVDKLVLAADIDDLDKITSLVPFVSEEALGKRIRKQVEAGRTDNLTEFYPFLDDKTLMMIAKALMSSGNMKDLQNILPFVDL